MTYICEFSAGKTIYLDNQDSQTQVLVSLCSTGQQQQSSSCFLTGAWLSPPVAFLTEQGLLIKINAAQGESYIQTQGTSMGLMTGVPDTSNLIPVVMRESVVPQATPAFDTIARPEMEPMQPMRPMQPMKPMKPLEEGLKMGDMQMNLNPMQMQMGNMKMSMESPPAAKSQRKFCTQCGGSIALSDRFCGSCGQSLQ